MPIGDGPDGLDTEALVLVLATMSDELRTPLNAVIGCSSAMLHGLAGNITDEQRVQLTMVRQSGEQLLALVKDIVDAAGNEARKISIAATPVDVSTLLKEQCDSVRPKIHAKGLKLVYDHIGQTPFVMADGKRLGLVMRHLLSNAIRYTDNGLVRVAVQDQGDCVRIDVSDTGIGVPETQERQLFKPFWRSRDSGRSGIGLAVSKRLVKEMHGDIGFAREVGGGSRFWITLPSVAATRDQSFDTR